MLKANKKQYLNSYCHQCKTFGATFFLILYRLLLMHILYSLSNQPAQMTHVAALHKVTKGYSLNFFSVAN